MVDYFAVLGVSPTASDREIKEAYRRLAKEYHPDTQGADLKAAERMRLLNEAKEVLFDPIRREEHKLAVRYSEALALQRIEELRRSRFYQVPAKESRGWPESARRRFYYVLGGMAAFVLLGLSLPNVLPEKPLLASPIEQIIQRHQPRIGPFDKPHLDTITIPNEPLAALRRKAELLAGFGELRSATKYLEKCLRMDPENEELAQELSMLYFRRGRYARSLELLSRQMQTDSSRVIAYYNIGLLFLRESKPFDAANAFEEVERIAARMHANGQGYEEYLQFARKELEALN